MSELTRALAAGTATACFALLGGCASFIPTSGPRASDVIENATPAAAAANVRVLELTTERVARLMAFQRRVTLEEAFGSPAGKTPAPFVIGPGDTVEVSIWEAPPAALFAPGTSDVRTSATGSRVSVLPEQMVGTAGSINMPFVGAIRVAGRTPGEVEEEIARRLRSKANDPQVLVRVPRNVANTVTVVGEVANSTRFALTPQGERLLDALAAAGGFRQPVGKITIRLTRSVQEGGRRAPRVVSLPLETIITDPSQNIPLQAGDVVTALYQPNSLTVLGATTKNEEMNFEAQGITLAQTLGRAGGLQDQRSNPGGVFIFRFEDPAAIDGPTEGRALDGRVPVVYRIDLKDPASFFIAQEFPMRNKDVVYVANAPGAELQKFLNMISGVLFPLATIRGLSN